MIEHRIAVVAMACRFPGADNVEAYWELIRDGRTGLSTLDEASLRAAGVPHRLLRHPDYIPVAGLLPEDPMNCDPQGLGLSEAEAELMDPQQRLFLECVVEALDSAGLGRDGHRGTVGVFAGQAFPSYLVDNLGHRFHPRGGHDPIDSLHLHGLNVGDYLPARVAWQLGLTGPAVAVGATCATSLVAIHLAVNSLLGEECDTAIAGGVSLRLPQNQGYLAVPDGPFSRDGHTRSYGRDGTGTVFTQGAGAVVLRRLDDALRDKDPIHAVVLGTATGSDGADRVGFSAPSVSGQARVVAEALAVADVSPQQVGLLEGHGTGTRLGDPIEVRALNEVFGPCDEPWCRLGSVKSLIGHTDSAAGVAGFIAAVLAVEHAILPPTRHAEPPTDALTGSAFTLLTEARPWQADSRIAGISSFGIGGLNAHVVITQAPEQPASAPEPASAETPLLLSAASPEALERRTADVASISAEASLERLSSTLAHGVRTLPWRQAIVGGETTPAALAPSTPARLVAVFPGGGAQYPGMAAGLYEAEPVFAASLDEAAASIVEYGGTDPRLYALNPSAGGGNDPRIGLPALAAVELAGWDLLTHRGAQPSHVMGHSLGEYIAAVAAGAIGRDDALKLVVARTDMLADLPPSAMLSLALPLEETESLLRERPELDLAVVTGQRLCVVAGPEAAIASLEQQARRDGFEHRRLHVGVAAHSRLVDPYLDRLRRLSARFARPHPSRVLVSCLDGRGIDRPLAPDHWVKHLRDTVRFDLAMATASNGCEQAVFMHMGPGSNLAAAAPRRVTCWPERDQTTSARDSRAAVRRALAEAWCAGAPIDLERFIPRRAPLRLPAYPWQRRPLGPPHRLAADGALGAPASDAAPSAVQPLQRPVWKQEPSQGQPVSRRVRVALTAPVPPEAMAAWRDRGLEIDADAEIVVHLSQPTDESQLRAEAQAFAGLARCLPQRRVRGFVHLSLGAEEVLGDEPVNPYATATTALVRVLAQEVPGIDWVTVDLDQRMPAWDTVADEVARLDGLIRENTSAQPHRAVRGRRAWQRCWETWQPPRAAEPEPSVWVITGGFGSVGLALAKRLQSERPKDRVVLAGRNLPLAGEQRHEAVTLLDVALERVDVAEPGALTGLLERVRQRHGRIDVVVHAPTQVDLAPLAELDQTAIEAAFAPKVTGALELATAVAALPQQPRVLLLSSVAGTIGGFGLGAYVAAGRFLDGFALLHGWTTLDLDRIRLGTEAETSSAAEISMRHALEIDDAVTAILRVVGLDAHGYLAASPDDLNPRTIRLDTTRTTRTPETAPAGLNRWEREVAHVWSAVLGQELTSPDADFFALGGHSLLATRALAAFRNDYGVELRLRDLLAAPTVATCARLLEERAGNERNKPEPVYPADEHGLGLTRIQHAYWIGRRRGIDPASHGGEGVGCHFYLEYEAPGLDTSRYQQAWRDIITRHPMLRAIITEAGEHRIIDPPREWVPPIVDLSTDPDPQERLARLRQRWSTRVADPSRWPLIQPVIVRLPGDQYRVLLSVDVLVCDSASWLLVDREIRAKYLNPDADLGPAPPSFAACQAALAAAQRPRRAPARSYWLARMSDLPGAPAIASRIHESGRPHFTRLAARVPAKTWRCLRDAGSHRHLTPTALVLARYREALARWSGQDHFTITLTVFDRPDLPGVENVVGEFSTMLLHEVEPGDSAGPWESERRTQERLVDDLDHREFSGLEVLAELSRARGHSVNVPVVFTSMLGLGQSGNDAHDHEWLGPLFYGVSQTPQVWLDHQAFEHRGDLVLQWDVCDHVIDLDRARAEFDAYVASFGDADEAQPGKDDALRAQVEQIWADLLGVDPGDIGSNTFLTLGGDSLLAVRMASELRRRVGVGLPLDQIRTDLTVSGLVGLIAGDAFDSPLTTHHRTDPTAPFPLLPLQQGYFVGQCGGWELSYDTAHVSTDVSITLPDGVVDVAALERALRRAADAVCAHQPMVRAQILPDGTQRIRGLDEPGARTPTQVIDLRAHPDPERELGRLRETWAAQGPHPATGPGVTVDVVLLGGRRGRLHVSSSLMLMDGWSAALYDRELFAQLNEPGSVEAPLEFDFGDYVESLASPEAETLREDHRKWWWDRIDALPPAPRLPRRPGGGAGESMAMREFRIETATWDQLRDICQRHGVTPSTALLSSFALALRQITGQERLLLNTMQHNRIPLHPDVDHLIGAFARTALLPLHLPGGTFLDMARVVSDQAEEYGRHHLVTAVDVGREMRRRSGGSRPVAPVVFQSTIGMDGALGGDLDDQAGPFGSVDIGDYHQTLRTPQVELELRCFELNGHLVASLASVDSLLGEGVPERVLDLVRTQVHDLLDPDAWVTPVTSARPAEAMPAVPHPAPTPSPNLDDLDPGVVRAIEHLWRECLGLAEIAPDDDFFRLGGDSLLAVRMLAQVRAGLGLNVTTADFLRSPTVAGLARAASAEAPPLNALTELRSGRGHPIFLLHPSGGDVLCYLELARLLDTQRPVIAISDPGLNDHPMPTSVGGMVELYRELIRRRQPEGPLTLAGWSMGGTITQELARRAMAEGEAVAALAMIDSNSPERIIRLTGCDQNESSDRQRLRLLRSVEAFLGLDLGTHDEWRSLAEALASSGAVGNIDALHRRFPVFQRHLDALAQHEAGQLFRVPALLLRAAQPSPRNSGEGMGVDDADEADLGWGPWLLGPLEIHEIQAHHYSILKAPAVSKVAAELSRFFRAYPSTPGQAGI